MRLKHNKKRNTAFVYEALVRELTKAVIKKDNNKKKKVVAIIKEFYSNDTELFKEWFQAFAQAAGITLHVENLYGENNHHIVESCFKGLARSLRMAIKIDNRISDLIPSTKGSLSG